MWIAIGLVAVVLGLAAYVRLAPTDAALWHVDPLLVAKPARPSHYLMRDGDGDAEALVLTQPAEQVAATLAQIALATPRTTVVAGEGGFVTYVTRSALWGFPDFTSVRILPEGEGSRVTIFARSRFGESDMGVNRKRVEAWLSALRG